MSRKAALKYSVIALTVSGLTIALLPFFKSMTPPDSAIYQWQTEIDISNQAIGKLVEHKSDFGTVWVYRRTPEQIEWLSRYTPTKVIKYVTDRMQSESFGGHYRSIKPEYFVFTAWVNDGVAHLQEGRIWYGCGTIQYHDGDLTVSDEQIFKGVITCADARDNLDLERHMFVYDVAGVPASPHVAPLEVPYYEYNKNGNIVVGPKPY